VLQTARFTNTSQFFTHRVSNLKYFTVPEMEEICAWLSVHCASGKSGQVWLRRR
jgi:hypothetical protein